MRVLLLGEFSSLHKFLKEGLLELGNIDVTLAANGDGWKNIGGNDLRLYGEADSKFSKCYRYIIEPFQVADKFADYDVVQFINTRIYHPAINEFIMHKIAKKNNAYH